MTEYGVIPVAWRQEPPRVKDWVDRSLKWAGELPKKEAKRRKRAS